MARVDVLGKSVSDGESYCCGRAASYKTASIHVNSPYSAPQGRQVAVLGIGG